MGDIRTVVWSSLYRFSTEAALEVIALFEASPERKESTCTFDKAGDAFLIKCTAESERSCGETIHAIIAGYVESNASQEQETSTAPKVERIKETRLSDWASEGDDEKPTGIEMDNSLPKHLAKFEFICTWCATGGNQDLAGTYFNGVYLVEELTRGTPCSTWVDFSRGIITIGGDDFLAVMKIFAGLENIEKHYYKIRNKRRLETHLSEIEGEDRQSIQLRFFHLAQIEERTGMARTTLTARVPTQQYPLLSVVRLLKCDHNLRTFSLPKTQLKPVRELHEKSKPRSWAGYLFKHHGQNYDILEKDMLIATVLPPTEMTKDTVQKLVDSNPAHSGSLNKSETYGVGGANEGPDPPTEKKHATALNNRHICRIRRVKVRPQAQEPTARGSRAELSTPTPAAIGDGVRQPMLIDMADHQGTMDSLIQPLLPFPSARVTSPSTEILDETSVEVLEPDSDILAKPTSLTVVENTEKRSKNLTDIEERPQEVSEVDTRESGGAMGEQKELAAVSTIDSSGDSNMRMLNDGAIIALENSLGFVGLVELKMKVGRILVRDVPSDLVGTGFDLAEWANFPFKGTNPSAVAKPLFTDFLTTSFTEEEFIVDLETDGQRIFGERPYMSTVHYELFCVDKEDMPYTIYIDGETFKWDIKELRMTFGRVYRHFPIRSWDSKLVVKGTLFTKKYNNAAKSIVDSIYIPPNQEQLQMTFQCTPDNELRVLRVMLRQETRYITYPKTLKIALCVTQMQRLKLSQSATRHGTYTASADTHVEMVSDNRLWYSVAFVSQEAETMLKENLDMAIGQEPSWSPADIVKRDGIIERLESVSNRVIRMIDNVGFYNKSPQWAHIVEQQQAKERQESERADAA
ncbi:MAG: hypothetical protein M1839_005447 [Geoglossum umbratile]|nr:MAG: hypothetical protein M1839_005447 [Geoglossum umbratile]